MLSIFYSVLALLLCPFGLYAVYEYRSYTDEQRARAPRLSVAYLGCGVLMIVAGVGGVLWLLNGRNVWATSTVLIVVSALPCFVQWRLHRKLEVDRSPLTDRLGTRVARKFNVPEN